MDGDALAFVRSYGGERMICLFNLSDQDAIIDVGSSSYELVSSTLCRDVAITGSSIRLGPIAFSFLQGA